VFLRNIKKTRKKRRRGERGVLLYHPPSVRWERGKDRGESFFIEQFGGRKGTFCRRKKKKGKRKGRLTTFVALGEGNWPSCGRVFGRKKRGKSWG